MIYDLRNVLTKEEIANKFNVKVRTLSTWNLPKADLILGTRFLWYINTINQWESDINSGKISKTK